MKSGNNVLRHLPPGQFSWHGGIEVSDPAEPAIGLLLIPIGEAEFFPYLQPPFAKRKKPVSLLVNEPFDYDIK